MKTLEQKIKDIINSYEEKETVVFEGNDVVCDGNRQFQYFEGPIDELISIWGVEANPEDVLVSEDKMLSQFNNGCYYAYEVEENVFLFKI